MAHQPGPFLNLSEKLLQLLIFQLNIKRLSLCSPFLITNTRSFDTKSQYNYVILLTPKFTSIFFIHLFPAALKWFRRKENVEDELTIIKSESQGDKSAGKVPVTELLTNPSLRAPLIVSCVIMLGQQFSGINAVCFYSFQLSHWVGLPSLTI